MGESTYLRPDQNWNRETHPGKTWVGKVPKDYVREKEEGPKEVLTC